EAAGNALCHHGCQTSEILRLKSGLHQSPLLQPEIVVGREKCSARYFLDAPSAAGLFTVVWLVGDQHMLNEFRMSNEVDHLGSEAKTADVAELSPARLQQAQGVASEFAQIPQDSITTRTGCDFSNHERLCSQLGRLSSAYNAG